MKETFFLSENSDTYLVINNGARVLQNKYFEFAKHLSENGINTITYDYASMGQEIEELKMSKASIQHWVENDMNKIIENILQKHPQAKIYILGHSLGGQIIGLSEYHKNISGIILVATQTGNYRYWNFPLNIANFIFWKLYVPVIVNYYGYFPAGKNSGMEHMPKLPALEWMKWCQSANYLFDNVSENKRYYKKLTCPLLSISFHNDIFATKQSVDWFTEQYANTKTQRIHYESKKINYGHSALFEPENFSHMCIDIINFIKTPS